MKTLILYATKHGAAGEAARRIAGRMGAAAIHDLKQGEAPSLAGFDCVIVGSSLYAGAIRKEAKAFLAQHAGALQGKKYGLFLVGMDAGREGEFFRANFAPEVLQSAAAASFLGGIFDPKKANFLERLVVRAVAKTSAYFDAIDDDKIDRFVAELTK